MKRRFFSGYMALTTAVIITLVMALIGFSLSLMSLMGRTNSLASTSKHKSQFAAEGCLDQALLSLSLNSLYTGNETLQIQVGSDPVACTIMTITTESGNKVIKAKAIVNNATTNLVLKVNATTLARVSLEEINSL